MDNIDKKILSIIQRKAGIPLSELSKQVGISSTPCWNRIKKMEEEGIILSKITVLDNTKINLPIIVFLSVSISSSSNEWLDKFKEILNNNSKILEAYRLTGSNVDYLLKIIAPTIEEYDKFQQELIAQISFTHMSSSISLKELKKSNYLPLDYIND
jgi:Lrp/AsnC family transcriptional regulator